VQTLSQKQGTTSSDDRDSDVPVPRPAGSAGNNFNIQDEMGLGRNAADREQYLAIQVRASAYEISR
jgi:hypothetical protein